MGTPFTIVVPAAGAGSRFSAAGYDRPKPFIRIHDVPMVELVLRNLMHSDAEFVIVLRTDDAEIEQNTIDEIVARYGAETVLIDRLTEGTACTVLEALVGVAGGNVHRCGPESDV